MDGPRRDLIAAGEALRGWVSARQAVWADAHAAIAAAIPVQAADFALAMEAVPDVASPVFIEERAPQSEPILTRLFEQAGHVLSSSAELLARAWRPAIGAAALTVAVWAVRANWYHWTGAMEVGLAAARRTAAAAPPRAKALIDHQIAMTRQTDAPADVPATGRLEIETDPPGARVSVDGLDRGSTPVALDALSAGSHTLLLKSAQGTLTRTAIVERGRTTQVKEAIFPGWLHLSSSIEVQVSEGARTFRLDDNNQTLIAPGPHDLVLENRMLGFRDVRKVDIQPGRTTAIVIEPPASTLTVEASEAAAVDIDGVSAGPTPLADYGILLGPHEIVVTAASGVVRRLTTTVTSQPGRVDVDFSKPN